MATWFIAFRYLTSRFNSFAALLTVASSTALLIVVLHKKNIARLLKGGENVLTKSDSND